LTYLLKKDEFCWIAVAQDAFAKLKFAITHALVLALPNFSQPFILETYASGIGIGAILSQQQHPIAYFSKKLSSRMQNQSAYAREMYAITEALAKFRHYLLGHQFIICTNQQSLQHLTDQSLQTPEQQKWLYKFMGFDFKIEYKSGKENVAANSLSRSFLLAWSETKSDYLDKVKAVVLNDGEVSKQLQLCLANQHTNPHFSVKDELLYWKKRLVIPANASLIKDILKEFHSSPVGGHAGIVRTMTRIKREFYWPRMQKDIRQFVQHCVICQQAKSMNTSPAGLLQPLPIPNLIWEDVAMDFITGLRTSFGYSVIMVVVDRLSKYAHFSALTGNYNSKKVVEVFMLNIVKLHGMPKSIVFYRDKVFESILATSVHNPGEYISHVINISSTI